MSLLHDLLKEETYSRAELRGLGIFFLIQTIAAGGSGFFAQNIHGGIRGWFEGIFLITVSMTSLLGLCAFIAAFFTKRKPVDKP